MHLMTRYKLMLLKNAQALKTSSTSLSDSSSIASSSAIPPSGSWRTRAYPGSGTSFGSKANLGVSFPKTDS